MATYFLDTGVLLGFVRAAPYAGYVDKKYAPSTPPNLAVASVVSVAELYSFSLRRGWGRAKQERLTALLRRVPATPIRQPSILHKFAEIDAFNHRSHPTLPPPASGHTMGDNDLWIAATASVLNATLLTTDHDFDHLDGGFLKVIYIDQRLTPTDP
ncbi:MAG: type II toxin-antitoxin system VapC family toxin [Verrucomicrobia bacterium]|nr:type II toxin-antitoxin system VapC family toxin [Verrucomicrobiota bacterium]